MLNIFKKIFTSSSQSKNNKKNIESKLAHQYLDNLIGIEIGGSAHNSFGLNTINVDRHKSMSTVFKLEEEKLCGKKCLLM